MPVVPSRAARRLGSTVISTHGSAQSRYCVTLAGREKRFENNPILSLVFGVTFFYYAPKCELKYKIKFLRAVLFDGHHNISGQVLFLLFLINLIWFYFD